MSRYILYARKSSESEDRQVLSIDSQIQELRDHARSRGLAVVSVVSEAMSAKAPGRPLFAKMMQEVSRGRADGILCWKLDRLARNPVDGGALIWAVDTGKLSEIATRDKSFGNRGDDKFWMQLEFGMAKKYVDDLSENTRRGNRAKLNQGWLPGVPPLGYLNDLATKTIVRDPERFQLVRQMWKLVLSGRSVAEVLQIASGDWRLQTPKRRHSGGRPVAPSTFYRMLSNPFYYGLIVRNHETYPGAHEPMISKAEYDRVQELLGKPNRRAPERHDFAFTSLIRCGQCGASITAELKKQRHGHEYVYYHCTKRLVGPRCSQPYVQVAELEGQIQRSLKRIHLDDELARWALGHLQELRKRQDPAISNVRRSLADSLAASHKEEDALLQLRLRGLISDEEFARKKRQLVEHQVEAKHRLDESEQTERAGFEPAEKAIIFANQASKLFSEGTNADKREIVMALGSNLILEDRILRISAHKPFLMIEERRQSSGWGPLVNGLRTYFINHPTVIEWPKFIKKRGSEVG